MTNSNYLYHHIRYKVGNVWIPDTSQILASVSVKVTKDVNKSYFADKVLAVSIKIGSWIRRFIPLDKVRNRQIKWSVPTFLTFQINTPW